MFSIARFDDERDNRSYDKSKDRLAKLNDRVKAKRKHSEQDSTKVDEPPQALPHDADQLSGTRHKPETKPRKTRTEAKELVEKPPKKLKLKSKKKRRHELSIEELERLASQRAAEPEPEPAPESAPESAPEPTSFEDNDLEPMDIEGPGAEKLEDATANVDEPTIDGLQPLPDFQPKLPTAAEMAAIKSMGIPDWLAHPKIFAPETATPVEDSDFGLSDQLVRRCKELGIEEFFAVQTAVIPIFLRSRSLSDTHRPPGDLCVSAPTGSGKTLAYVLPIIEILSKRVVPRLRALIILPTRDLVGQVKETFDAFCKGTDLRVGTATGQHSFPSEQVHLVDELNESHPGGSSRVDVLITTPGRLIDHLSGTPNFTLQHLRFLVIDEADRLLNQSYQDWLAHILRATRPGGGTGEGTTKEPVGVKVDQNGVPMHDAVAPSFFSSIFKVPVSDIDKPKFPSIQKLLFSATLTRNPAKIASLHLLNPQYVAVQVAGRVGAEEEGTAGEKYTTPAGLREHMLVCATERKPLLVLHLLHNVRVVSALCFTKSVESAHRLCMLIQLFEKRYAEGGARGDKGVDKSEEKAVVTIAAEYSSDLSQAERNTILRRFKRGEIRLLICSDLIARGIDLDRVDTVISYDVPLYMKKYVHRVGRTARAGREGDAYTLVETQEARHFKEMLAKAGHAEKVKKKNVKEEVLAGMVEAYHQSLADLQALITKARPSVARYQSSITVNAGNGNNSEEYEREENGREGTHIRFDES